MLLSLRLFLIATGVEHSKELVIGMKLNKIMTGWNTWNLELSRTLLLLIRPILVVQSSRVQIPWVPFFFGKLAPSGVKWTRFSILVIKSSNEKFKNWLQQSIIELFELLSSFFFWVQMHLNSNGKWVQKFKEFTFFFTSGVFVD